jgi:Uma2 family endonuclease
MASRVPAKPRATYEDLAQLPEYLVGEVLDGELHASPRPSAPHALAASTLQSDLGTLFQRGRGGPGGWWILSEPELHFGDEVAVPDLAGWRRDRMPSVPNAAFLTLAPDWVCEVVSPSTERIDRVKKLPLYAREKVGYAWLVNPTTRTLEVLRNEGARWLVLASYAGDAWVRAEPFEAVELDLLALWGEDRA